ncbi:MAG TPA: DUF4410 domain-containing protein [Candidatus Binataceae bacterium]|nr:DUF4410 domain-containing protein [Candidatus Binataceae bacterium]
MTRALCGCAILCAFLSGCASTQVVNQSPPRPSAQQQAIPRPNQIWVYSFIATPSDVPSDSSIAGAMSPPTQAMTPEQIEEGHKLGAMIAERLVTDIQETGLPAAKADSGTMPQVGDGVIRGYLVSVDTGSAVQRFTIGFGAGKAELDTVVEGYIMTPNGLRKLGSGTLSSTGNKTPGVVAPAAVALATGNPIGLIVVGGAKLYGEASGRSGIEGRADATADAIAEQLKIRFQDRGWLAAD